MITERKETLRPILESSEGIHLTVYLVNRGDLIDLKSQLRDSLAKTHDWLQPVMTTEDTKKFLEPLDGLLTDARIFKEMKGNIGIFRTKDNFRILNMPVELEAQTHLATSFHVKPLLRWMQMDREFLLLGLEENTAHLYLGSQSSLRKIDSILFPGTVNKSDLLGGYLSLKQSRRARRRREETYVWLNTWIEQMTRRSKPRLFLAGDKPLVEGILKSLEYKNVVRTPVALSFSDQHLSVITAMVRGILRSEAKRTLERYLMEFRAADELNLVKKNIFQIARAAVKGRVKKLIVADGVKIFGKIDKTTGGLAIHPFDVDHEDDDLLDDLAQTVLNAGGEVIVAPKEEIPNRRPILAIVESAEREVERVDFIADEGLPRPTRMLSSEGVL